MSLTITTDYRPSERAAPAARAIRPRIAVVAATRDPAAADALCCPVCGCPDGRCIDGDRMARRPCPLDRPGG